MASFDEVRHAELNEIQELRRRRRTVAAEPVSDLSGLCFSGGGIRSATFCLGVLQGLATYRLLRRFDYISSVSGGGYISTWLVSWIKRPGKDAQGESGMDAVEKALRQSPPQFKQDQVPSNKADAYQEPGALNFLRSYSNYLTPRMGLLGADTWQAVSSYIRNLLLNQAILFSSLAAIILVPRFAYFGFDGVLDNYVQAGKVTAALALFLLLFALAFIDRNLADFSLRQAVGDVAAGKKPERRFLARATQGKVLIFAVLPMFLSAVLGALSLAQFIQSDPSLPDKKITWWIAVGALGYLLCRSIAQAIAWLVVLLDWRKNARNPDGATLSEAQQKDRARAKEDFWAREKDGAVGMLLSAPFAGILGGVLLSQLSAWFLEWICGNRAAAVANLVSWGPPLLVMVVLLTGVLHVGLTGYLRFPNQKKEWWSRLAAWLLIWSLGWTSIFALALFAPLGVLKLSGWIKTKTALILSWAGTTAYGVLAGKSSKTSGERNGGAVELFASIAPYVFIVGTLVLISYGMHAMVAGFPYSAPPSSPAVPEVHATGKLELTENSQAPLQGTFQVTVSRTPAAGLLPTENYWNGWKFEKVLECFFGFLVVAFILAWRVDINEFSLHLFYRNRLVRCYLGATNPERCPHPFTGFDPTDDILLRDFSTQDATYSGPYPLLNAALNISHGQRLAWQERRAESFVLTPKYCGFDFQEEREDQDDDVGQAKAVTKKPEPENVPKDAYRQTCCYAYPHGGPYIGTAMAISGAAVNPNMGYHASAAVAFLLTLFNVRLGWWMGNPRRETWTRSTPRIGLFYLLGELFGMTDDTSRYVNLSDGWHFENLGLYELVRRRCMYILVCDVGADASFGREDLGNAVRKCRSDFGAEIVLDASPLSPQSDGFSKSHFATGTVHYPDGEVGRIIYIKSALTGSEPQDILAYKIANPAFPHQGTGDQWFDESQFESYRALGRFAMESVLDRLGDPDYVSSLKTKEIFERLS